MTTTTDRLDITDIAERVQQTVYDTKEARP